MYLTGFFILLSVFVSNIVCQSSDPLLQSLNSRADTNTSTTADPSLPSEERQRQIREEYYKDKRYRDMLAKEDAERQAKTVVAAPVVAAAVPAVAVPLTTRQMPVTYQQQSPYAQQQPVAAAVPVQQGISPTSLLTSGFLSKMLSPPAVASDPSQAAESLIPRLITPSLQQGLNAVPLAGQQGMQPSERQLPMFNTGLGTAGIPNFGSATPQLGTSMYPQTSMPMQSMYPQTTGMMQNPYAGTSLINPMATRGFDNTGMSGLTGAMNPALYGNTALPQQTGFTMG